jgi:MoxR-like ATPase
VVQTALTVEEFQKVASRIEAEVGKVIVGQREVVRYVLVALIGGGHVLLEGVPGLGKTMLVRTLASALNLKFSRIQFTPDLMPSDITGTMILVEDEHGRRTFQFQPGPIFANLVLADEVNRATPKTQSALLEAMQERTVTVSNTIHRLSLPEAQLDRFFFKLLVSFPQADELIDILNRTTTVDEPQAEPVADGEAILAMGELARGLAVATPVMDYIARLVLATHPGNPEAPDIVRRYVRYGSSPRGAQALVLGAKIMALLDGRFNVAIDDVRAVALPALRHRIILNFEGQAEGIQTDQVVRTLLDQLPVK